MTTKAKIKAKRKRRKQRLLRASDPNRGFTIEAGVEIEIQAAEGENVPSFEGVAYTGVPMRPGGWTKPYPVILDLRGGEYPNNHRVPIHRNHDIDREVGHSTEIKPGNELLISGLFSALDSHDTQRIRNSSKNGLPWQMSVGVGLKASPEFVPEGRQVHVNGRRFRGPVAVARSWKLREVSFVTLGADDGTSAVVANEGTEIMTFTQWVEAKGFGDTESLGDDAIAVLTAQYQAEYPEDGESGGKTKKPEGGSEGDGNESNLNASGDGNEGEGNANQGGLSLTAQAAEDFRRIATVQDKLKDHPLLAAKALEEGWNDDKIDLELLKTENTQLKAIRSQGTGGFNVHVKNDDSSTDENLMAAALLSSSPCEGQASVDEDFLTAQFGEKTLTRLDEHRRAGHIPRRIGLQYLLTKVIQAAGGHVTPGIGMSRSDIERSFEADRMLRARASMDLTAASGFSTISNSGVLSNIAHKRLLEVFRQADVNWRAFARIASNNDFKQTTKYRVYGIQDLKVLPPGGEIEHTTLKELTYTNQVKTYAEMIALTFQDMKNDDLDAFLKIPAMFGFAARRTLQKSVFKCLVEDGGFYDPSNSVPAGATSALQASSLETAMTLAKKMRDPDGNPVDFSPTHLVYGSDIAKTAEDLLTLETIIHENGGNREVKNKFRGKFQPLESTWLDDDISDVGGNGTNWFLTGGNVTGYPIEVAFLDGQQEPDISSSETDFNTLGMQWRVVFHWGCAKEEKRAVIYSPGQ
ncbi:MAG: Mu-like prophage major head subunit gpT family protein [Rubripirellula sp.]